MARKAKRETVDLSQYPDLVVVYLGMRVNTLAGIKTTLGMGPKIEASVQAKPDGLLLHENLYYSFRHVGMRQYWRDFESLERWTRAEPHRQWWSKFLKDMGGSGFWHETYMRRGGFEAVYLDMFEPMGMGKFAPLVPARGSSFSARTRAGMAGGEAVGTPVNEKDFYS
jgi:hypothetical protein